MVTRIRIITRRIISSGQRAAAAAAAAKDSDRDDGEDNRLKDKRQDDDDDKHDGKHAVQDDEETLLCSFQDCQNKAADRGVCDGRSYHDVFFNDDTTTDDGKAVDIQRDSSTRKRPLLSDDADDDEERKRWKKGQTQLQVPDWTTHFDFGQRRRQKFIDLSDAPPQLPIISSRKNHTSKYQGVSFDKANKKWQAQITLDGKTHYIGNYANEEDAGIDYARAVFKYNSTSNNRKRQPFNARAKFKYKDHLPLSIPKEMEERHRKAIADAIKSVQKQKLIDLTDVPPKLPIKTSIPSSSKYQGVCFDKKYNKWKAQISIDGERRHIGTYDNEEEAAVDYARAKFKYKEDNVRPG